MKKLLVLLVMVFIILGCSKDPRNEIIIQLDIDEDGVYEKYDICPNTSTKESVDYNGCSSTQNRARWTNIAPTGSKVGDIILINTQEYIIVDNKLLRDIIDRNGDYGRVITTYVTDMSLLFYNLQVFKHTGIKESYLYKWDVSNVTTMEYMFSTMSSVNKSGFQYGISNWDVSNVIDMSGMFEYCYRFNDNLTSWDTNKVIKCKNFDYKTKSWEEHNKPNLKCIK